MNILDRKKTPNLIVNLLYLRDYTKYPQNTYGKRLDKNQATIDILLMAMSECKIQI